MNAVLNWEPIYKEWAYILWHEPGTKKVRAVKDLAEIESKIIEDKMKGWIAESEFQYTKMHRILEKLGARVYAKDDESFYFMKVVV